MSRETFAGALRAEIEAVVARWDALAAAREEALAAARDGKVAALEAEIERLRAEAAERRADEETADALRARVGELVREITDARAKIRELEDQARAALETTHELEVQFSAERRFVTACRGLGGSLLGEALKAAVGREIESSSATYGALKARGLEVVVTQAMKERGRSAVSAPLLERERGALPEIAAAAGCELIVPPAGTRFSALAMEKASTVSDPAEEGNVIECLVPGVRRSGTDGALVFPRVVVASG